MQVLDYSGAPPPAAQIAALGFAGAVRYIAPEPNPKVVQFPELGDYRAHGLAFAFVFESTAGRALLGAGAGHNDAIIAAEKLHHLGAMPAGGICVYMAVDFPASGGQLAAVAAYIEAARTVLAGVDARCGVYGSYLTVKAMLDGGHVDLAWQTVAWSGGHVDPRRALMQTGRQVTIAGTTCDVNDVIAVDWGQWPRPFKPAPNPEDIMPATCIPSWAKRHPDARVPFYVAMPLSGHDVRVNAYNGAPLTKITDVAFGVVPYFDVTGQQGTPTGLCEIEDTGAIVVTFSDGGVVDVAAKP